MNAAHVLNQRISKSFCFRPLTGVLTRKSNAPPGGPQIPHCTELNACQMPGDFPGGMGGFGIDWYINSPIINSQRMRIHVAFPHTFSVPRFLAVSVSRDVPFALSPFLPFLSMQCAVAFSFPGQINMHVVHLVTIMALKLLHQILRSQFITYKAST